MALDTPRKVGTRDEEIAAFVTSYPADDPARTSISPGAGASTSGVKKGVG